jgi:UDP-N-acetylmuramate--alanine ligase
MIGAVLVASGLNPTVHNGARPNLVIGGKDFFVTEACEFKRSFLALNPTVAVVTNIDADHLDCYRDIDEIRETFAKFTGKATKVITHDSDDMAVELSIPGAHNVGNAALAVKVGLHFGIPIDTIKAALKAFGGVERRFQTIGKVGSAQVIVDYAHHPTEIETTIQTAQSIYGDKFLVVFQPHTYTRTIALFDDFVATLKKCDCVMYKTFSAREKPMRGGDASDLATTLGVEYFDVKKSLQNYIKKVSKNYKAIILTGAGDINKVLSY